MTPPRKELDLAAVYSESLRALREASKGVGSGAVDLAKVLLLLKAAKHLLLAASGPEDGPTSWNTTRTEWLKEYAAGQDLIFFKQPYEESDD